MQTSKKPLPLITINEMRARINTNPDFQRPAVWGTSQKQLLVDTILRDYDIPKLYWRRTGSRPDTYDVVDGQQRLRAIFDFFDGKFKLPKDAEDVNGGPIKACSYLDLPDELRSHFISYPLDVIVMEDTDDDEVREMFLRLQNGTSLKAQEKRNAYPGKMRAFVRALVDHRFFKNVGFDNSRLSHDHVAAQLVCLEINGGPTNIKNADLNKMYENNEDFDDKGDVAKSVRRVLDFLVLVFPEKTPELERFNVITLYCVVSELMHQYVVHEIRNKLRKWFLDFEMQRHQLELKPEEEVSAEWFQYREKISHSTDAGDSVRWRMEFLLRNILEKFPALQRKDNQRDFTHVQKLAIFRRDDSTCQIRIKCDGAKLTWDDWHCDHKIPWIKGGKTTVENGQAACVSCNLSKGGE